MKVYKLVRIKNNKLYSLFINRNEELVMGKWLIAKLFNTKGFKERKGWHCCVQPIAPHLKMELSNGEKRIWVECEVKGYITFNRPKNQGNLWVLSDYIKINRIIDDDI